MHDARISRCASAKHIDDRIEETLLFRAQELVRRHVQHKRALHRVGQFAVLIDDDEDVFDQLWREKR